VVTVGVSFLASTLMLREGSYEASLLCCCVD
jgi:hypothetical protein